MSALFAQDNSNTILLLGATAHIGNGEVIQNSAIGIKDGTIELIVDATTARFDRTAYSEIVDITGKHVYPGFIAAATNMGLREIGAVRATADDYEVGDFNPHVRSAIAFNTDSRVIPTVRSNGVLLAQVTPLGGRIQGTSSIMHLSGWNWEDALVKENDAIHMRWPQLMQRSGWWGNPGPVERSESYDDVVAELADFFDQAKAYSEESTPNPKNLRFEAMRDVFDGSKKVFIRCRTPKEITEVIRFGEKYKLDYVLVDAAFALEVADLIKEYDVPLILEQTHRLPPYSHSDYDQPYKTPALLAEAGIKFGLTQGSGWDAFWDFRNLPFHAAQAIPYGLNPETALASITGDLAEILGLDNYGTLENGKDATLIVSEGDVLDVMTNNITHAWIHGQAVDLDDKQKQLNRKFREKFNLND
ncbi:MAG: imidazolonepropionase-like amidohydrolase [Limisphaerales bacterium]|jgi:imidazolonepropionase-like amidohydrolase